MTLSGRVDLELHQNQSISGPECRILDAYPDACRCYVPRPITHRFDTALVVVSARAKSSKYSATVVGAIGWGRTDTGSSSEAAALVDCSNEHREKKRGESNAHDSGTDELNAGVEVSVLFIRTGKPFNLH